MAEAFDKLIMPLVRATSTGVAAFNINGRTTYSPLKLPGRRSFEPLPLASLTSLQEQFKNVRYLILDEKSMIGLHPSVLNSPRNKMALELYHGRALSRIP
jgi:hypothetical protein